MMSRSKVLLSMLCAILLLQLAIPVHALASSGLQEFKVNFIAEGVQEANGYLSDYGESYGDRGDASYGWDTAHTSRTVTSVTYAVYDTSLMYSYIRLKGNASWEIDVENGNYEVHVAVGAVDRDSMNTLQVENQTLFQSEDVPAGDSHVSRTTVAVTDGRLTLTGGATEGTSLQYIEVRPLVMSKKEIIPPTIGWPADPNTTAGHLLALGGAQNNEHRAVPAIPIPGLANEITRFMNEQAADKEAAWQTYIDQAVNCSGCSPEQINQAIANSSGAAAYIRAGHLNLDNSATFGSQGKPVFLIVDGMNTNQALSLTVYGTLIVNGNLNANQGGDFRIISPDQPEWTGGASLRIAGTVHLNNDANVEVDDDLLVGALTYNSGDLTVSANRLIVENSLHINTRVAMNIMEYMAVGELVSNNETANLTVEQGDFFVKGNVHVNNSLNVQTGGVWAIGGDLTSNQKPDVASGVGDEGQTLLKYAQYGLRADYFTGANLSGEKMTVLDPQIALNGKFPVSSDSLTDGTFSVRWTGELEAYSSETYTFETATRGGVRLWINDALVIDSWSVTGNQTQTGKIDLERGTANKIRMEFNGSTNQPRAELSWSSPVISKEVVPSAQLRPFAIPSLLVVPSDSGMEMVWTSAFNADGYELEVDGAILPLESTVEQYAHNPLDSGTFHTYRIRAASGDLHGGWSELHEVWTLPGVPDNIALQSTSDSIRLDWDEVRGAVSYEVETDNTIINVGSELSYVEEDLNANVQRTFRIRAVNSSGPGIWSELFAKTTLPGMVGGLKATPSDVAVHVDWDAVSGAEWYELEVDGQIMRLTGTQYGHESLSPNTVHEYRVRAGNSEGDGGWSEPVETMTLPSVPANVRAESLRTYISLEWDAVTGATEYEVEADGVVHNTGLDTSFVHLSLLPNTEHTYRVRAGNGTVWSDWTEIILRSTLADVPVNIQVVTTEHDIALSWDPVIGATGYEIEVDGGIEDTGLELSYVNGGLASYSEHTYRIRARSAGGVGEWSETVTAITMLGKPEGIRFQIAENSIAMQWDAVDGADSYELLVDGAAVNAGSATQYTHTGLEPNSWHVYRIRATNSQVTGEWSEAFTQLTGIGTPVITSAVPYSNRIKLTWDAVIGADGYELEANGSVIDVGNMTEYVNENLSSGHWYSYRVRALSGGEAGPWSEAVSRYTSLTVPQFTNSSAATDSILLEWTALSGNPQYDLELDGEIISGMTASSYRDSNLESNTMHVYRVRSRTGDQTSEWSQPLEKKTVPELLASVGENTMFNLIVVAPPKPEASYRTIVVTYNPDEVEVLDLCTITPTAELSTGAIEQAKLVIQRFVPGEIVIRVLDTGNTFVNGIRFLSNTNDPSKITYVVK
ncbi:PA14 domain-containing protein [Paenibacillus sp. HB172176]|uniref:fibronectin type III domain-containing protein n=1 Tax=Paenibacillus sp. HB172176 TaxID=2493690 RepID=UPI001439C059|nr:PA14 domain-containing protein [Paenibacillus sp. HB172176]